MKKLLACLFLLTLSPLLQGETLFRLGYQPGDKFKIVEVSDWRKRVNGRYAGFTFRQVRGLCDVLPAPEGKQRVQGEFYVFQETKRDTRLIANQVDRVISTEFEIYPDGRYAVSDRYQYPTSRDFPVFSNRPVKPGDNWRAFGIRYVEPFLDGVFTRVSFYCDYTYKGVGRYKGVKAHLVTARYALRYKAGDDPAGDPRLKEIRYGGHQVTIYFDLTTGKPLFMKDLIVENLGGEHYIFTDNTTVTMKGFTQTWYESITSLDRDQIREDIGPDIKKEMEQDNIRITDDEEGLRLTLPDIRFHPDSPRILASEAPRLDALAAALAKIEGRSFLVIGHTADIGQPEEQYKLSVARAKAIVDYMVKKGIQARRFLYEGRGGQEPLASNDTEAGRSQNRRVEVMILED